MKTLTRERRLVQDVQPFSEQAGPQHAQRHPHEIVQLQQHVGGHYAAEHGHDKHT